MNKELIDIIAQIAKIPSFSSYEEKIHPFIYNFIKENDIQCEINKHFNNIIIEINKSHNPIMAFTAHLDKIDHFNREINELSFEIESEQIKGQLDDAVGVGICLYILKNSKKLNLPHSLFLFSEMEEGFGLRHRNYLGR